MYLDSVSVSVGVCHKLQDIVVVLVTFAAKFHNGLVVSDDPRVVKYVRNLDSLCRFAD